MSEFGSEVLVAARTRHHKPFRHHFKPDLCSGGQTTFDECMSVGLNDEGYDCSGLVIASICDVLGIDASEWPNGLRHTKQMAALAIEACLQPGDVVLFDIETSKGWDVCHMGIYVRPNRVLHASGSAKRVVEGWFSGGVIQLPQFIPAAEFVPRLNEGMNV